MVEPATDVVDQQLAEQPTERAQGGSGTGAQSVTVQIPCRDVTVAADVYGDPRDTAVVLLHGGGQTRHSWGAAAAHLGATGWYALTVDLRGHGDSGWSPNGEYGLDAFAGDVESIAAFLGKPPVVVGASLGGSAALAAFGHQPELGLGLVLVDVSPFVQPAGTDRVRRFMTAHPEGYGSLEEVADAIAAYVPHRQRPRNLGGLRKNLRQVDGRWFWHWDPAFLHSVRDQPVHRNSLIDPVRLGAASRSLRVPTLLVRGGDSDVLAPADAKGFLELVPHAEFARISGAGHMVAGDDNTHFGYVLDDFLERRIRPRLRLFAEALAL
jgi:pimeloyl-ACP methyl ester carboxylesterase